MKLKLHRHLKRRFWNSHYLQYASFSCSILSSELLIEHQGFSYERNVPQCSRTVRDASAEIKATVLSEKMYGKICCLFERATSLYNLIMQVKSHI